MVQLIHQQIDLNTLEYIGTTHTDSIFLPAIYIKPTLEVEYTYVIKNVGDVDYLDDDVIEQYNKGTESYKETFFSKKKFVIIKGEVIR